MQCDQCKGSGEYTGLFDTEPCQKCSGLGTLDDDGNKHTLDKDALPNWMEDHKDRLGEFGLLDITHKIKSTRSSQLKVDDVVSVWSGHWYKARVLSIDSNLNMVDLIYPNNIIGEYCHINKICWNFTQQRWEYILSGTPTW